MIPPGTLLGGTQVTLPGAPVIGQVDPDGRLVQLGKIEGWWDPPPSTGTSTPKVNDHGTWLGPAYYGPRILNVEARVDGFTPADSLATAQRIIRAVSLDQLGPLTVADENETLQTSVRQEADPLLTRSGNRVTVSLSLHAPDPRRYFAERTASVGLPASSGGLSLPLSLPLSVGATVTDGVISIVNVGDTDGYLVFTVRGPTAPFSIVDAAGRQISYNDTVPAGRQLIIDTMARTALLDGTANRVVTGTWPRFAPGLNQYSFNSTTYYAGSRLVATYRSARR